MIVASDQKPMLNNIMEKETTTPTIQEQEERYPILKNENLVKQFLGITMTNNQKGNYKCSKVGLIFFYYIT